jgi:hypothetical protein
MQGFLILAFMIFFNAPNKQHPLKIHYGIYVNDTSMNKIYSSQLKLTCSYRFEYSFKGKCFTDHYYGSWKAMATL